MLTFQDRIEMLRETKLRQTREKRERSGYWDTDDHGTVPLPLGWSWTPIPNHPNGCFYGPSGWAANFRSLMEAHPTYVDPVDAFAGRWMVYLSSYRKIPWKPEFPYSHLAADHERYGIIPGIGASQHFGPDYSIGLRLGWGGLLDKVRRCRAEQGPDRAEFYQAEEDVILGVQTWIHRTVAEIRAAEMVDHRPEIRRNLREMADANEWIAENPPRTLREACQWVAWFQMVSRIYNGDGAGDQIDVLFRPYYESDRAAGRIDDEEATFLLACFLLNDPHYHQIGGPDAGGRDVTNPLSFLILEAAHRLGIPCNLTVRVHGGLDRELFHTAVTHLLRDRKGWPRFAGDKGLVEGFMRNGYPVELARQRICVGCHWFAIPGREYTVNDCVKINVAKVFETAFWEMLADGEKGRREEGETTAVCGVGEIGEVGGATDQPSTLIPKPSSSESGPGVLGVSAVASPLTPNAQGPTPSVAELWSRFESHLRRAVERTAEGLDFHLAHQHESSPELLINLLCDGPIEKGRDASDGGVELYNLCVDGSGLATAADSFAALYQRVEREGRLTWAQVAEHLRNDFAGVEGERARLMLRGSERYGQGGSLGDEYAVRISRLLTELVKAKPTPGGRMMIPGWFSWSNTIGMGKILGATPNGRKAGQPISHGANPDPGFRRDGAPTAMAQAIAAIQPGYGNAAPIQLEVDPGLASQQEAIEAMESLIRTHFDQGGTLFNVNVLDSERILAAHKDPTAYPDLVVRVTGFTAYFASLSPAFRQLVVDRLVKQ